MRFSRKTVLKTSCAAFAAAAAIAIASGASAQEEMAGEEQYVPAPLGGLLLPPTGQGAANHVYVEGRIEDEYPMALLGAYVPVYQPGDSLFFLHGEVYGGFGDDDSDFQFGDLDPFDGNDNTDLVGGTIGVGYRTAVGANSTVGANVLFDIVKADDFDTQYGMSAGLEYQYVFNREAQRALRIGGNVHVPFSDAEDDFNGDAGDFAAINLIRVPRFGVDGHARYGSDINRNLRYDVTLTGFWFDSDSFEDSDDDFLVDIDSDGLWGGTLGAGLIYTADSGFYARGEGGARWLDGANDGDYDGDVGYFAGLRLGYAFGGETRTTRTVTTESAVAPPRDCVVVRDADGQAFYECSRPVVAEGGVASSKDKVAYNVERLPVPAPTTTSVTEVLPGYRIAPILRQRPLAAPCAVVSGFSQDLQSDVVACEGDVTILEPEG